MRQERVRKERKQSQATGHSSAGMITTYLKERLRGKSPLLAKQSPRRKKVVETQEIVKKFRQD